MARDTTTVKKHSAVLQATLDCDLDAVVLALKSTQPSDFDIMEALELAAQGNSLAMVRALAQASPARHDQPRPLYRAAKAGRANIIKLLVGRSNKTSQYYQMALNSAAQEGFAGCFSHLAKDTPARALIDPMDRAVAAYSVLDALEEPGALAEKRNYEAIFKLLQARCNLSWYMETDFISARVRANQMASVDVIWARSIEEDPNFDLHVLGDIALWGPSLPQTASLCQARLLQQEVAGGKLGARTARF